MQRRTFLGSLTGALAGLAAAVPGATAERRPQPAPVPTAHGSRRTPVTTLNGRSADWTLRGGVKEFHLVAEPIEQEVAPGMKARLWGYNGSSPGPTIEAVEGDRVRIHVTNRLPEHTTVHWHGLLLPCGMDGVGGLTQPHIPPGRTCVYEFTLNRAGTFMYHPHADEMVQMALGMMGLFIVHPKNPAERRVDRDYALLLAAYDIAPDTMRPNPATMSDFNLWTFNSRTSPAIAPMVARQGERVRIRVGNLTMTNHPIHLHGHTFTVTGTDGGWVPASAQWPEVATDVAVGQMRVIEFVADAPGDWSFHCHKAHHTMGPMGHAVPNLVGTDQSRLTPKMETLLPGSHYMAMGSEGMAQMQEMAEMGGMMPLPANTLPMMSGQGPFGPIEMGGMFTVLKVRADQAPGDYRDPGWYAHPKGTQAWLLP
ncbi:multicopper oxidase family protein [Chitinimonas koreensis]|uniref:multicopper oxidase family protein n=1 Tax=Chitinimonas koreensis TaxID=356302 RepID=UPI000403A5F4|nr:copper oxidase [Chitinimonas koreensis]QNM98037.1 copper oxidase [Chitinimonas koreensis]